MASRDCRVGASAERAARCVRARALAPRGPMAAWSPACTLALVRLAWPLMLRAATVRPAAVRDRRGQDTRPSSSSWLTRHQPWLRACCTFGAGRPGPSPCACVRRSWARRGLQAVCSQLRRSGQAGQQHPAHGRAVGRQARAHAQRDAHDLVGGHAQHIDDVGAVEHGGRTRFLDLFRPALPSPVRPGSRSAWTTGRQSPGPGCAGSARTACRRCPHSPGSAASAGCAARRRGSGRCAPPPRSGSGAATAALKERITSSPRANDCT